MATINDNDDDMYEYTERLMVIMEEINTNISSIAKSQLSVETSITNLAESIKTTNDKMSKTLESGLDNINQGIVSFNKDTKEKLNSLATNISDESKVLENKLNSINNTIEKINTLDISKLVEKLSDIASAIKYKDITSSIEDDRITNENK